MNAKQLQAKRKTYFTQLKEHIDSLYTEPKTEERRAEAIDLLELLADIIDQARGSLLRATILTYTDTNTKKDSLISNEYRQALQDSQEAIYTIERLINATNLTDQEAYIKHRLERLNNAQDRSQEDQEELEQIKEELNQ
jgi:hypothetical protein